jgi:rhamnulokinase
VEGSAIGNLLVQAWASGDLPGGLDERAVVAASTPGTRSEPRGDGRACDRAEARLHAPRT